MSDPYIGEIRIFAGNFAPNGWAMCNGQLMPISQNTALFSLLGTYYGGNGQNNFALPNLTRRVPLHQGQGPGLRQRFIGESAGVAAHQLTDSEMPAHTHQLRAAAGAASSRAANAHLFASVSAPVPPYHGAVGLRSGQGMLQVSGGSQPHNNLQPYLTLNFIIALQGIYPPRN
jgi:microcystin-dependent protein